MSILYVLYKSPLTCEVPKKALEIIERQVEQGNKVNILLLADSVIASISRSLKQRLEALKNKGVEVYALKEDLEARGITTSIAIPISYSDVVDLLEKHDKVYTWS